MKIVSLHPVHALDPSFSNRDFGQIGFVIGRATGLPAEVRCLESSGQKNFVIHGQKWVGSTKLGLMYRLWKDAKNIKLLHTYHIFHRSLLYGVIYKVRNPHGIHYIKLDAGIQHMRDFKYVLRIFNYPILCISDIIGYEDKRIGDWLCKTYKKQSYKIIQTTNGITPVSQYINKLEKENIILLCGRFGSSQKNNELLLDMLERYDVSFLKGWKIVLMGGCTEQFLSRLNLLYLAKPETRSLFILLGFVYDNNVKYSRFAKAKIFLHTAKFEGDPNIQYDSMFGGCFMVSTDVANISQNYPSEYSIFYSINDVYGLYKSLLKGVKKISSLNSADYLYVQKYCLNTFTWDKVLQPLIRILGDKKYGLVKLDGNKR